MIAKIGRHWFDVLSVAEKLRRLKKGISVEPADQMNRRTNSSNGARRLSARGNGGFLEAGEGVGRSVITSEPISPSLLYPNK